MVSVEVGRSRVSGHVRAPSSKSYTHRFLCASMLAEGVSVIREPLLCDDTSATIYAAESFGAGLSRGDNHLAVTGRNVLRCPGHELYLGDSGTTLRLMTSMSALTDGGYTTLTGSESLRRRPMGELIRSLRELGVEVVSLSYDDRAPIRVKGGGIKGGEVELRGDISSQFATSILMAAPYSEEGVTLTLSGRVVSRPYLEATIASMGAFGVEVHEVEKCTLHVEGGMRYHPAEVSVPGDFSSSAFLLALGSVGGDSVSVGNLISGLPQPDSAILRILEEMGAEVSLQGGNVKVSSAEYLEGGTYDLSDCPDLLPVLAALSVRCRSTLRLEGIRHTKFKESDRPSALAHELSKLGLGVEEGPDYLSIQPADVPISATLNPHGDHRLFMAFVVAAVAAGVRCIIEDVECVSKSYPSFVEDIRSLGVRVAEV